MASNSICIACCQALRLQSRQPRLAQTPPSACKRYLQSRSNPRLFSTIRLLSAAQEDLKPIQPKAPSTPTRSETSSETTSRENPIGSATSSSPTRSIAEELRKRASSATETYVAYGVCEKLVRECSRQADYTIPQAHEKNVSVPKTKDGEDLGVGTGWWFESKILLHFEHDLQ